MYINCLLIYFPSDYTLPEDQDCTMKKKKYLAHNKWLFSIRW